MPIDRDDGATRQQGNNGRQQQQQDDPDDDDGDNNDNAARQRDPDDSAHDDLDREPCGLLLCNTTGTAKARMTSISASTTSTRAMEKGNSYSRVLAGTSTRGREYSSRDESNSRACCKRKVGQGRSGEPPPNRRSVATSGWSILDSRWHTVCRHTVAMLGHEAGHCLTDIVFDTANRMARLPEMTFIVIKTWEMVNASLTSDSQVSPGLMEYQERHHIAVPHIMVTVRSQFIGQVRIMTVTCCMGDSTNLKSSDGHPARPHVTILGFKFQAPHTLPNGPQVMLHSAGMTYKRHTQAMVIHCRTPHNIPIRIHDFHTTPYMVSGYVWQRWPHRRITSTFVAVSPLCGHLINTSYVNIECEIFLPRASPPEVYDTIVQVSCYKLLVTGYLNSSLGLNPNLQHDFPLIPWKGEIAVLFIGKWKPYVSRAPPQSLVCFAITQYMEVCIAHVEVGSPFLSYIKRCYKYPKAATIFVILS
ncbi:hypothetical protein EDB89DRAFT_1908358 [Lactarius sanguifluus]|nr:hypothetical protein EDB89DRAFT_1908358 [Lactarius sanguifluus]